MEGRKGRSRSFHEDDETEEIPRYQPPQIEHMKLTLDDDGPYPAVIPDDDDDDDDDDEIISRGRSRSRSVHCMDVGAEAGTIPFDPNAPSTVPFMPPVPSDSSTPKVIEAKTGPLQQREVEALKKGIEEAIPTRNPDSVREEQEEQLAAEEEKQARKSVTANSSSAVTRKIKVLMLGDSGVGKSSLILRWTQDTFSTDLVGTVGVNFKTKKLTFEDEIVQAQVWDTAGQEQFHKITTSYYKGANGIMLVFDLTDQQSVKNVEYWMKNIKAHASDLVQVTLIGNKIDLRTGDSTRCLDSSHGRALSQKYGVPYFETSAKDGSNVDDAFQGLVSTIVSVGDGSAPRKSIVEKEKGGKKEGSGSILSTIQGVFGFGRSGGGGSGSKPS